MTVPVRKPRVCGPPPPAVTRADRAGTAIAVACSTSIGSRRIRRPLTLALTRALACCPHLKVLAQRVGSFAGLFTGRRGDRLDAWIDQVGRDDLLHLCSFAVGLARDYDAVVNGLTLTWSSGPVEGNVNRIKMLNARCTAARSSTCSAPGSSTHDR
jgi:transposase